jgi:hypothetical protein
MSDSRLGEYSRILGICAAVNCPLCMSMRRFRLLHVDDGLTKDGFYAVSCEVCGSARDVPRGEAGAALTAMELYGRFARKEIDATEYRVALDATGFRTLRELHSEGTAWKCPACHQVCPDNFAECWNCHAMRPGLEVAEDAEVEQLEVEAPKITRYGNPAMPWEG